MDKDIINFILNMEPQGEEVIIYPKTFMSLTGDHRYYTVIALYQVLVSIFI